MKVQWIELSQEKRKALHIILIVNNKTIDEVTRHIGICRASLFNKLNGFTKFKKVEYQRTLEALNITEEELEQSTDSFIVKLIVEREQKDKHDTSDINCTS